MAVRLLPAADHARLPGELERPPAHDELRNVDEAPRRVRVRLPRPAHAPHRQARPFRGLGVLDDDVDVAVAQRRVEDPVEDREPRHVGDTVQQLVVLVPSRGQPLKLGVHEDTRRAEIGHSVGATRVIPYRRVVNVVPIEDWMQSTRSSPTYFRKDP